MTQPVALVASERIALSCPASIQTRQALVSVHDGWHAGPSQLELGDGVLRHSGEPAAFSDGPGQDAVFLVPGDDGWITVDDQDVWMNCAYVGTKVLLSRPVPDNATRCRLDADPATTLVSAWCEPKR